MPIEPEQIQERHKHVARSRTFRNLRTSFNLGGKRVFDVGCGFGEYLTHFGIGSIGITTTPSEVQYAKSCGLPVTLGNAEALDDTHFSVAFEAVWANNLFEHLLAPHAFLMSLKRHITPNAHLVLGVPVIPVLPALMRLRRFRGALASNHINFFTRRTLRLTIERAGWVVKDIRPFYFENALMDRLFAPFAPHLYLIAENDTNFTYPAKKVSEWEGDARYASLLAIARPRPSKI